MTKPPPSQPFQCLPVYLLQCLNPTPVLSSSLESGWASAFLTWDSGQSWVRFDLQARVVLLAGRDGPAQPVCVHLLGGLDVWACFCISFLDTLLFFWLPSPGSRQFSAPILNLLQKVSQESVWIKALRF